MSVFKPLFLYETDLRSVFSCKMVGAVTTRIIESMNEMLFDCKGQDEEKKDCFRIRNQCITSLEFVDWVINVYYTVPISTLVRFCSVSISVERTKRKKIIRINELLLLFQLSTGFEHSAKYSNTSQRIKSFSSVFTHFVFVFAFILFSYVRAFDS